MHRGGLSGFFIVAQILILVTKNLGYIFMPWPFVFVPAFAYMGIKICAVVTDYRDFRNLIKHFINKIKRKR